MTGAAGRRLALGDAWAAAVVATLVRPLSWALGLLGFLAGGGLVLVAWPILVLPTPTGIQTILGAPITTLVFGVPTAGLILLAASAVIGGFALVAGAVVMGAWAERQGIGVTLEAAAEEGAIEAIPLEGAPGTLRVTVVRLLALGPVVVVMVLSAQRVYDVVYRELILPDDLVTPLPVRVAAALPVHLGALLLAWLLADSAAAMGVRRLVLERRSVGSAWVLGWYEVVRRPLRVLGTAIGGALAGGVPARPIAGCGCDRLVAGPRHPGRGTGPIRRDPGHPRVGGHLDREPGAGVRGDGGAGGRVDDDRGPAPRHRRVPDSG